MKANLDVNAGLKDKDTKKPTIFIVIALLLIFLAGVYWKYHPDTNSKTDSETEIKPIDTERHVVVLYDTVHQPAHVRNIHKDTKQPLVVKSNDTIVNNHVESKGDNNHIINGDGNTVGVNGDVNINKEKELTEADKVEVLRKIKDTQQKNNILNNDILFFITNGSNAAKFMNQLQQFLSESGYNLVNNGEYGITYGYVQGYEVYPRVELDNKTICVHINVGSF